MKSLKRSLMICTDLDRTLIPNGTQSESNHVRKLFKAFVDEFEPLLVYVTGRDKELVDSAIQHYQLPIPNYLIADVGASIYQSKNKQWLPVISWSDTISEHWQGKDYYQIHQILKGFNELRLQETSTQKKHKLSYFIPLYIDHLALMEKMQHLLKEQGIYSNLIYSVEEQKGIGLLDVLPINADKLKAIEFLIQQLKFNPNNTLFSGDSGNDLSVLSSPLQAVLVANASIEVKKQATDLAKKNKLENQLYIAKGDFFGMNGNYSAGILEGVEYFFPASKPWFESLFKGKL